MEKEPLKILIKFPSRGRVDRFFKSLESVHNNVQDQVNYHVSCTLDYSDIAMNNSVIIDKIKSYPNTSIAWGESTSKINAVNRDIPNYPYDIICVLSDDIEFTFFGFDTIIRQEFEREGLDILLHIPDNDAKDILAIMYIAGRDFYLERGYIYNPIYLSLFCDNAIQKIAEKTGRYRFLNCPGLIFHSNPAYNHIPKDAMFIAQQEIGWTIDQQTYIEDEKNNFGL